MGTNDTDGICYPQPNTIEERVAIASDFVERFEYRVPLRVDSMADGALEHYAAWPERLYVIDEAGIVALKGGIGPILFDPDDVEDWLAARFADE
jgi:hypothetical protein